MLPWASVVSRRAKCSPIPVTDSTLTYADTARPLFERIGNRPRCHDDVTTRFESLRSIVQGTRLRVRVDPHRHACVLVSDPRRSPRCVRRPGAPRVGGYGLLGFALTRTTRRSASPTSNVDFAEQKYVAWVELRGRRPAGTPVQVRGRRFSPNTGSGGYNRDEVDAFVDRVEAARRDPRARAGITPAKLHTVTFARARLMRTLDRYVDDVKFEFGLEPNARSHERWAARLGVLEERDPDGVRWKVSRQWGPDWIGERAHEAGLVILMVLSVFKWLGVRWRIAIYRDGIVVATAKVRGWRKSQWCIQQIAESATAGRTDAHQPAGRGRQAMS